MKESSSRSGRMGACPAFEIVDVTTPGAEFLRLCRVIGLAGADAPDGDECLDDVAGAHALARGVVDDAVAGRKALDRRVLAVAELAEAAGLTDLHVVAAGDADPVFRQCTILLHGSCRTMKQKGREAIGGLSGY